MKYYYDIILNFNEYPINYYEWEKDDDIERFIKIKVIKVDDVKDFILYNMNIELADDVYVLSDGVNSIAIEVISKHVAYISSLTYEDELNVCNLAKKMEVLGEYASKEVKCVFTPMDEPIGKAVGNSLEVIEAINFLKGKEMPEDLKNIVLELGSNMIKLANKGNNLEENKEKMLEMEQHLKNLNKWLKIKEEIFPI